MALKEIAALNVEYQSGGMTLERSIAVMAGQLAKLEEKAAEQAIVTGYLHAKLSWMKAGAVGDEPAFPIEGWADACCAEEIAPPRVRRPR